jgi:hypothetical protein
MPDTQHRHPLLGTRAIMLLAALAACDAGGGSSSDSLEAARDRSRADDAGEAPSDSSTEPVPLAADAEPRAPEDAAVEPAPVDGGGDVDAASDVTTGCSVATNYEPNDSFAEACGVSLLQTIESQTSAGDLRDYYSFQVEAGRTYALRTFMSMSSGASSVTVTTGRGNSTDTLLGPSIIGGGQFASAMDFTARVTGTAFLAIEFPLHYTFELLPGTDDGLLHDDVYGEPNDTPATAYPLALEHEVISEPAADDAMDYYRLQVEAGARYQVQLRLPAYAARFVRPQMNIGAAGEGQLLLPLQLLQVAGTTSFTTEPAAITGPALLSIEPGGSYRVTVSKIP